MANILDEYGVRVPRKNANKVERELYNQRREEAKKEVVTIDEFRNTVISYLDKIHESADTVRSTNPTFNDFYNKLLEAKSSKDIHMVCMEYNHTWRFKSPSGSSNTYRANILEGYFSEKDKIEAIQNNIDEFLDVIRISVRGDYRSTVKAFIFVPRYINDDFEKYCIENDLISKTVRRLYLRLPLRKIIPNEYKSVITEYVQNTLELFSNTNPRFGLALFSRLSDNTLNDIDKTTRAIKIMDRISETIYIIGFDYRNTDEQHSKYITLIDVNFSVMGATTGRVNAVEFCNKYKKYLIYYIVSSILADGNYKSNIRGNKIAPIKYYKICELRTNNKTGDSQIKFELRVI